KVMRNYWAMATACSGCPLKEQCTTGRERRIKRWEHEAVLEAAQDRLDKNPDMMTVRRSTVEHPFGTLKFWMGHTHFLMKRLRNVRTEMSLHVLSYNMKRVMKILGVPGLLQLMQAWDLKKRTRSSLQGLSSAPWSPKTSRQTGVPRFRPRPTEH